MLQPSTIESSTGKEFGCPLGGLMGDSRLAKVVNMLHRATEMAHAVGKLDPEAESRPNGRHRSQRRNSFVFHRSLLLKRKQPLLPSNPAPASA
jgi:hypothetical protein